MTIQTSTGTANTVKPGYKTTEGLLSALAAVFSVLVALKWVPLEVSTKLQQDAVLALPAITGLYAIARGITKHGAKPGLLPLIESAVTSFEPVAPPASPPAAAVVTTWTNPPVPPAAPPADDPDLPPLVGV